MEPVSFESPYMKLFLLPLLVLLCSVEMPLAKSKVVATYKNHQVTDEQFSKYYESFSKDEPGFAGKELSSLTPEMRSAVLREYIKCLILEEKALEKRIDKSPDYRTRLDKYSKLLLRESFIEDSLKQKVNDSAIRGEYQAMLKKIRDNGEVKFQCMVFPTKDLAEKALADLSSGKTFAEVAKKLPSDQKSLDEAKYFSSGDLAPGVEEAVFALAVGKVSMPIDTGGSWCLIKVTDKRPVKQLPSFERLAPQIKQKLYLENRMRMIDSLMKESNVRIIVD